jgi:hypothetical protein
MYLKSVGILPDCVVVLNTTRTNAEENIISKLKQSGMKENLERIAKNSYDESELAMNAIREIYKGFLCEIPTFNKSQNSIAEEISVNYIISNLICSIFSNTKIKLRLPDDLQRFCWLVPHVQGSMN